MSTSLVTDCRAFVEEQHQISFNLLFSESPDFSDACSCDECRWKIEKLKNFEEEIRRKKYLVGRYDLELESVLTRCSSLLSTVGWTQEMLELLKKHLDEVYKKLGAKFKWKRSHSHDLRGMYHELVQMHTRCNLTDEDEDFEIMADIPCLKSIGPEIHRGFIEYDTTRVMDEAFTILQQMVKVNDMMEKGAEVGLNPSIFKHYIKVQIELLMKLPVGEVYQEAIKIIHEAVDVTYKQVLVGEAFKFISGTCRDIIRHRDHFWRHLKRPSCGESNEHTSNGLNHTLDSLLQKVHDFKYHWEKEYAPIIEA